MGLIKLSGKLVKFTGELMMTEGFEEWISDKAQDLVEKRLKEKGFLFAKEKRSKKSLVHDFKESLNSETLKATIQRVVEKLPSEIGKCFDNYKYKLFNYGIVSSTYALPVVIVRGWLLGYVKSILSDSNEFKKAYHSKEFGEYFFEQLINDYLEELDDSKITPSRPYKCGKDSFMIGLDNTFDWYIKGGKGHYYILNALFGNYDKKVGKKGFEEIKIQLGAISADRIVKIRDGIIGKK